MVTFLFWFCVLVLYISGILLIAKFVGFNNIED